MARPPQFKYAMRLSREQYVLLCRLAGKNENVVADVLYHLVYSNEEPQEIEGLMPRCSCSLS